MDAYCRSRTDPRRSFPGQTGAEPKMSRLKTSANRLGSVGQAGDPLSCIFCELPSRWFPRLWPHCPDARLR